MYLKLIKEKKENIIKEKDYPFYVYLSLSNMCNANCIFCDVKQNTEKKCNIDVYKLIDELYLLGTKYIHFTGGGEPFINDDIYNYMEYCTKKNINIIFISNGLNLNEEKIKKLKKYNISAIFFSIDSYSDVKHDYLRGIEGIFSKVTQNINTIKEYMPNVKIVLNHVLNKENISEFDKFILLKKQFDFDYINPIIIKDCDELFFSNKQINDYNININYYKKLAIQNNIEFFSDNINFFEKEISNLGSRTVNEDLKCIYPSLCAFVDAPSGNVYPCDCSIHRDKILYNIGNLKENSFLDVWDGIKRQKLKKMLYNSELNCKLKCDEANCKFNNYIMRGEE